MRRQRSIPRGFASTWRWLAWPSRLRRLATALYFLALTWSMLAPASAFEEVGELFPQQDKIAHGALFMTLAALVRWSSPPGSPARCRSGRCAALLSYAVAIEALQPLLGGAGRQYDWLDMACNIAGAGLGWLLYGRAARYHAGRDAL
jgi:VanZ family protein